MPHQYEREHFRVMYPTAARPRFITGELVRPVVDLSELGMRYRLGAGESRELEDELEGVVRLRRGEEIPVRGRVVRLAGGEAAMRLTQGVPLRVILEEQRFLRERFRGMAW
jgi:hypothetical protein